MWGIPAWRILTREADADADARSTSNSKIEVKSQKSKVKFPTSRKRREKWGTPNLMGPNAPGCSDYKVKGQGQISAHSFSSIHL
jgi:hypothetical protein